MRADVAYEFVDHNKNRIRICLETYIMHSSLPPASSLVRSLLSFVSPGKGVIQAFKICGSSTLEENNKSTI